MEMHKTMVFEAILANGELVNFNFQEFLDLYKSEGSVIPEDRYEYVISLLQGSNILRRMACVSIQEMKEGAP
jgi:hypothetical protein